MPRSGRIGPQNSMSLGLSTSRQAWNPWDKVEVVAVDWVVVGAEGLRKSCLRIGTNERHARASGFSEHLHCRSKAKPVGAGLSINSLGFARGESAGHCHGGSTFRPANVAQQRQEAELLTLRHVGLVSQLRRSLERVVSFLVALSAPLARHGGARDAPYAHPPRPRRPRSDQRTHRLPRRWVGVVPLRCCVSA